MSTMTSSRVAAVALLPASAMLITVYLAIRKKRQKAAWKRQVLEDEEDQRRQALKKLEASDFFRDTGTFETFKNAVGGTAVILPSDKDLYHECRRRAFNENQRGFPLVIVRTKTAGAVAECVKYVRKIGLPLCVMSGGHSIKCMMTGSFVIDMYEMNQAELDLDSLTVQVQGGAYLEEVDKVLEAHNLGCVVGTYPKTGVGGLVLGGGYGWLARLYGFAVDNLLECEVVLGDGKIVMAKEKSEYEDLLWGLRGGSGNFGIVTKFKFRVHRLPTHCLSGSIVYLAPTLAAATQVASNFDRLYQNMPAEVTSLMVLPGGAPVIPFVTAYFGEQANKTKQPTLVAMSQLGGWFKVENSIQPSSYHKQVQLITMSITMSGHIYFSLMQFGSLDKPLPDSVWRELLAFTKKSLDVSLEKATLLIFPLGGQVRTADDGTKTCMSNKIRSARYFAIVEAYWKPEYGEVGKKAAREWTRSSLDVLRPFCSEQLRYASGDSDPLYKDQAGFEEETYLKLRKLKTKYDKENFFANNMNVAPL